MIKSSVGKQGAAVNRSDDVLVVQRMLNRALAIDSKSQAILDLSALGAIPPVGKLTEDGKIGKKTVATIAWLQKNVLNHAKPDGIVSPGGKTIGFLANPVNVDLTSVVTRSTSLPKAGTGMPLSQQDYLQAAKTMDVEVAAVKSVVSVESAGTGFIEDLRPLIRFEAHQFSRRTGHFYDHVFPIISVLKRDDSLVKGGAAGRKREFERLKMAMALDRDAALESTSWGLFQIMGFNYKTSGFTSLEVMIESMFKTEGSQLSAFVSFVLKNGLTQFLRDKNWAAFAARYNGESYKSNDYDGKLDRAYKRFNGK